MSRCWTAHRTGACNESSTLRAAPNNLKGVAVYSDKGAAN